MALKQDSASSSTDVCLIFEQYFFRMEQKINTFQVGEHPNYSPSKPFTSISNKGRCCVKIPQMISSETESYP